MLKIGQFIVVQCATVCALMPRMNMDSKWVNVAETCAVTQPAFPKAGTRRHVGPLRGCVGSALTVLLAWGCVSVQDERGVGRAPGRAPVDPHDSQAVAREVAELVQERSSFCNCAVQNIDLYRYQVEARISALRRLRSEAGADTRELEIRIEDAERERDLMAEGNNSFGSGGSAFGGGTSNTSFGGPVDGSASTSFDVGRQAETCRSVFVEVNSEQAFARELDDLDAACGQPNNSKSFGGTSGAQTSGQGAFAPAGNRRWVAHFVESEARFNECLLRISNNDRSSAACNAFAADPFRVEGCVRAYTDANVYALELAELQCLEQSPSSMTGADPGVTVMLGPPSPLH